ncbi:MAG: hypothetical protein LBG60_10830 [Bifidobacteriaceae bacterium]|nr:hypothetical protein [Bifidobacteriaceae bacterium]
MKINSLARSYNAWVGALKHSVQPRPPGGRTPSLSVALANAGSSSARNSFNASRSKEAGLSRHNTTIRAPAFTNARMRLIFQHRPTLIIPNRSQDATYVIANGGITTAVMACPPSGRCTPGGP